MNLERDVFPTRTLVSGTSLEAMAQREEEPAVFLPGERVAGRFEIVRPLGAGGMGQVFEAWDQELGVAVALKVIRPTTTRHPAAEEFFRREVQLARQVTHPNVCRIFDLVVHRVDGEAVWGKSGRPILALTMELLEGETLAQRVTARGPSPFPEAVEVLDQLASALDAAHSAGVLHCDFKAANIFLTESRAVVTDFGLARSPRVEGEEEGGLQGTPGYLAPEVLAGGKVTEAADLFALGAVAHLVLVGCLPQGPKEEAEEPTESNLERPVEAVLARALHADPVRRFPDGATFVAALRKAGSQPKAGHRRRWLVAAALASTVGILGMFAVTEGRSSSETSALPAAAHLADAREALRSADYPRGRAAASRAALAAQITEDRQLEAEAHLLVASAFEAMGELARADDAIAEMRQILEAEGDRCGLARASVVLRDTSDRDRTPIPTLKLPEILEQCGDIAHHAMALARTSRHLPVGEELEPLERALVLARQSGDPRALAIVWNATGTNRYMYEDLSGAEEAFGFAVEESRRAQDPYLLAGSLGNQGRILRWLGRYEEEATVVLEALDLSRKIGNRYVLIRILAAASGVYDRQGELATALAALEEARQLALELGDPMLASVVLKHQAALHEQHGHWEEALKVRRQRLKLLGEDDRNLEVVREELAAAWDLFQLNRLAEAEEVVSRISQRFPMDATGDSTAIYSRLLRVQIHMEEEEWEAAAALFGEILPYIVTKEEVGLRRDAARVAVLLDRQLGGGETVESWRTMIDAFPLTAAGSPEEVEKALKLELDLGRLLWFQDQKAEARQHITEVARRALGRDRADLQASIGQEVTALEDWRDYWSWRD